MADADSIMVKIEVKASDLVEACIKALTEDGTLTEVVRCRNCAHGTPLTKDQRVWCDLHETVWNPDGYCSGGKPKT